MTVTNTSESGTTVSVEFDVDLLSAFDEWWQSREYENRGQALRVLVRNATYESDGSNDGIKTPSDPQLREVYVWLHDRSDHRGRVPSTESISDLAQKLSMKEKYVKNSRLKPLERADWIRPNYTYIEVIERTPDQETEGE